MRFLVIGLAAAFLAMPLSAPSKACEDYEAMAQPSAAVAALNDDGHAAMAQASSADATTAKKKPMKKAAMKKKKEKVEYMRMAPMPPGAK